MADAGDSDAPATEETIDQVRAQLREIRNAQTRATPSTQAYYESKKDKVSSIFLFAVFGSTIINTESMIISYTPRRKISFFSVNVLQWSFLKAHIHMCV